MASHSHHTLDYSEVTSFEPVALDNLENPLVRQAVAYWRSLCGARRFPARDDLAPRALVPFQRHMILLRVIDDGADFEYRFVGEAQAAAYTHPVQGRRMSEMAALSPDFGPPVFAGYRYIQQSGTPFALRGWAGKDYVAANFAYTESVTLPLGVRDDHVDHLVIFSAYVPRDVKPVLA
jgi:hypothetical protein